MSNILYSWILKKKKKKKDKIEIKKKKIVAQIRA